MKKRAKSPKAKSKSKAKAQPKSKAKVKPKAKVKTTPIKRKRRSRAKPREAAPLAPRNERADLLEAVDEMVSITPGWVVSSRAAPASKSRTPWMLLSRFLAPSATYDDVFVVLRNWRDDATIERLIRPQRLSRIQVVYTTTRGKQGEYTIAEIGPWELAISRAVQRVGVRDDKDDALVNRYGDGTKDQSEIDAVVVWFSSHTVETLSDAPAWSMGIGREVIRGGGEEANDIGSGANTPAWSMAIGTSRIGDDAEDEIVELPWEEPKLQVKQTWQGRKLSASDESYLLQQQIELKKHQGRKRK